MSDAVDMPAFKDESDPNFVWTWDSSSKSYIRTPEHKVVDRSHATGGDNDLFDPASVTFKPKNPLQEGILASEHEAVAWHEKGDECPRCGTSLQDNMCPLCDRGWDNSTPPQMQHVTPFPVRDPKPNALKTDPSFPSMLSKEAAPNEIGKFVIDMSGHLHYEPGATADTDRIVSRDHVTAPGCIGSIHNDGVARIEETFPGYIRDDNAIQQQLAEAFGEGVTLMPEYNKNPAATPVSIDASPRSTSPLMPHQFAHVEEELRFLSAQPNLETCPQCGDVLMPNGTEVICHNCGHRQPVIQAEMPTMMASTHLAFLPALMGMLAGRAALPLVSRLMGGALGRGAIAGGVAGVVGGHGHPEQTQNVNVEQATPVGPVGPSAVITHDLSSHFMFSGDEIGIAVQNRGDDVNPAEKGTQGFNEEVGDSPELLKDVDEVGGTKDADPTKLQSDPEGALKAFKDNLPLVIEFADSDLSGEDHPLLKALDELLEAAFPGYRAENVEHHPEDVPPGASEEPSDGPKEEDAGEEPEEDDDDTEDKPEPPKKSSYEAEVPFEHLGWMQGDVIGQQPQPDAALPGAVPGAVPPVGAGGVGEQCPLCGGVHARNLPCPQNGAQQMMQPQMPMQQVPMGFASNWKISDDGARPSDDHQPSEGAGDTSDHDHGHGEHPGHNWVDDQGQPLQEGQEYELLSPNYAIPDKVKIDRVLPDKLVFTVHTDLMDYQDEMTTEDLHNEGYTFSSAMEAPDSTDGFGAVEDPIRPGQDAQPQVDDLSEPSTTVSSVDPSEHPERAWLVEDNDPVSVDPHTLASIHGMGQFEVSTQSRALPDAHYAGKDYSPTEQKEFIEEPGTARNADRLDLSGTHYHDDDEIEANFLW